MSNIGLNTNTFRITGRYLDFLNDFIVKAQIHTEINESKKDQLIEFISNIVDANNVQPQFQLLSSIIERELRHTNKTPTTFLNTLIQELQNDNIENVLPKIELLVEALDSENSDALAKIKGE